MRSILLVLLLVIVSGSLVCGQGQGSGGGTCYETRGRGIPCPSYNYTRMGNETDGYEVRIYNSNTYAIESANPILIPSNYSRPIEGIFETFRPLEEYFLGENDKKQNISRDTTPIIISAMSSGPGQWGYEGAIALPPMNAYPPPNPSNSSVTVVGGQSFTLYARRFSPDRSPTNEEINFASARFAEILTRDGVSFMNATTAAFYEFVGAPGNWTKEVWFFPPSTGKNMKFPGLLQSLLGGKYSQ